MTNYEVHQKIGEYNVGVIFLFDEYKESAFKKDFQEIIDYQNKKGFSDDRDERNKELDLKFYKQFDKNNIPKIIESSLHNHNLQVCGHP